MTDNRTKKLLVFWALTAAVVSSAVFVVKLKRNNARLAETVEACGQMGRKIEAGEMYYRDVQGKDWRIVLEEMNP